MRGEQFEPVEVMVDTGSTFTTVPADLLRRLGVNPQRTMQVRLADGSVINDQVCDTVIRLEGQTFFTPISFGREGEPNLLGVVALETALLAVDPVEQRLVPTIGWKA
jgi:predicted aspartyl protease